MYGIAVYCKDKNVSGVGLSDSNTTPGYTTLLCSVLDCGNKFLARLGLPKSKGAFREGFNEKKL